MNHQSDCHKQVTFRSYLFDLNSSTSCCRSASLLVPTKAINAPENDSAASDVLLKLREWRWLCKSVLIHPWIRSTNDQICNKIQDLCFKCLPSDDDLLFFNSKYLHLSSRPLVRSELFRYHIQSKSLLVPLTDEATSFILRLLFEIPVLSGVGPVAENYTLENNHTIHRNLYHEILSDPQTFETASKFQEWFCHRGIIIVHNSDRNQLVSLSKEHDSFPHLSLRQQADSTFTFVDLFAGIGGFRIAMEALGGKCVGSCEIDAYARMTYRQNFLTDRKHQESSESIQNEFFVNDIARLEIPPEVVDVLCGGFPCQSFSTLANYPSKKEYPGMQPHQQLRQGGLSTPHKGRLFFQLLRVLRQSKPKVFIFENVKGLLYLDGGSHFQKILYLLEESGYHVTHGIIDSSWFLPQRRERIFFVGIRLDLFSHESKESDFKSEFLAFSPEIVKSKYQIYRNDVSEGGKTSKYDKILLDNGYTSSMEILEKEQATKSSLFLPYPSLLPSRLGDILESEKSLMDDHHHCFLTSHQWQNVSAQRYLQIHMDGTGQLVTEDNSCAQTLVSSYRRSYLLHSQFVVPRESSFLIEQQQQLVAEALSKLKKKYQKATIPKENLQAENRQTLPRFFTPRECCRLQGFPESFVLPILNKRSAIGTNQQSQHLSQFYRQIGNSVSPPCVVAVAEYVVNEFLLTKKNQFHSVPWHTSKCFIRTIGKYELCPVFDLLVKASPCPDKVLSAIQRKIDIDKSF